MDRTYVCPDCHAPHCEPADAAFVVGVPCLDCELERCYHEEMTQITFTIDIAA